MTGRRFASVFVPFLLSAAALVWLLHDADFSKLATVLRRADLRVLATTYALGLLAFVAAAARTKVVCDATGAIRGMDAFRSTLVGYLGNAMLPVRAGELLRLAYISRRASLSPTSVAALVTIERVLDLIVIMTLAAFVLLNLLQVALTNVLLLGGGASLFAIVFLVWIAQRPTEFPRRFANLLPRWRESVEARATEFAQGLAVLRLSGRSLQLVATTVVYWAFTIGVMATWLAAFRLSLPWYTPFVLCVFVSLGTAIPATVAHLGTYHAAIVGALAAVGVAKDVALPVAVFAHAVSFVPWPLFCIMVLGVDAVTAAPEVPDGEKKCKSTA